VAERYVWPPTVELGKVAREIASERGLPLGERFPMSRFAYAAPLGEHVLKITPPEDDQADHEADALLLWAGDGAARVLWHDPRRRALLLERIKPGNDASTVSDAEAVDALLDVGPRLWRPVEAGRFRSASGQTLGYLSKHAGAHPLVAVAHDLFVGLEPREHVLLHGDLHHHNLLRGFDRWVAVDPKPLIGEREFDVAAFLWNPLDLWPTPELTERRIAAFIAGGLEERRLRDWAIVRGALWDLPLQRDEDEARSRALAVVRHLLGGSSAHKTRAPRSSARRLRSG